MEFFLLSQSDCLKSLRIAVDKTQKEMADICHCCLRSWQSYEYGETLMPIDRFIMLCSYFNIGFSVQNVFVDFYKLKD